MDDPQPTQMGYEEQDTIRISASGLSAVIPAFNEARRIGQVLDVLRQVPEFDKIIVVDDGSDDETVYEAQLAAGNDSRVQILKHTSNHGKGQAIYTGWKEAGSRFIMTLDADLQGLTPAHIRNLIEPVLTGEVDMTLGLFRGGKVSTDLAHWITPWLSGQRCMRSELIESLPPHAADGYGFETALTVTARAKGWRIRRVIMRGIWHPPSEYHRGLLRGAHTRLRMYSQIIRAWYIAGGPRNLSRRLSISKRILLLLLFVSIGLSLAYDRSRANSPLSLTDITTLPIEQSQRVLVIAPHPDDETIGAGGVIQAAIAQGSEVRVIVVTNGDGQLLAPLALNRRVVGRSVDYVADGERRQTESLAALRTLGVSEDHVYFLSYPDHYLERMWLSDWNQEVPVLGMDTKFTRSPYPRTYNPESRYMGKDVLADIQSIIRDYRPDFIFVPHPNDDHPDHRAASNFTRLAVDLEEASHPEYRPLIWGYLIHFGYYPQPRGVQTKRPLLPPGPLVASNVSWRHLDLTDNQVQRKMRAVQDYSSQMKLLGKFLPSFVRKNEIFLELPTLALSRIESTPVKVTEAGVIQLPTLSEPTDESTRRLLIEGADLVGWHVLRLGQEVWLTALTGGHLLPGLHYRIIVKTPDGSTHFYETGPLVWWGGNSFTARVDLAELGNPPVIGFAADVKQSVTLDRTAWHFLALRDR